jgi:YHS domain-containing protein
VARFILFVILILAAARFIWRLIEVVLRGATNAPPPGARGGGPPASVKMQPCPVCGTYVVPGKAISAVKSGVPIYFCSDKCRADYQSR